ncbi:MAG: hypothetical protein JW809_08330 [Pirellulales bacterium]|nr:hypothetical protein [Pirellulales bacterium]
MKNSVAALGRDGKRTGQRKQPFLGAHHFGIVALAFLVAIWSALGGLGWAGTLQAIHTIEFPDEFQFGRDIAWDGQSLWTAPFEKLVGPAGGSDAALGHVFALDPADGSVRKTFAFGAPLAERSGIAWDGSHLWVTLTAGVLNNPAPTTSSINSPAPATSSKPGPPDLTIHSA